MVSIRALFVLGVLVAVGMSGLAAERRTLAEFLAHVRADRPSVKWDVKSQVSGDFDGEGRTDFAALGYVGKGVVVAIGRTSATGEIRLQYLHFDVSRAAQAAICVLPARLELLPLSCAVNHGGALPGCKEGPGVSSLRLMDDECDSINIYWNRDRNSMSWWRN